MKTKQQTPKTDWAWVAGVFEGEGTIQFVGKNSAAVRISMTDEDILARCLEFTKLGYMGGPVIRDGRKPMWYWLVTQSKEAHDFLNNVLPWLGIRRSERALAAIDRLMLVRKAGHCNRGHRMTGENLYVSPGGQKQCKKCIRIRDSRRCIKT